MEKVKRRKLIIHDVLNYSAASSNIIFFGIAQDPWTNAFSFFKTCIISFVLSSLQLNLLSWKVTSTESVIPLKVSGNPYSKLLLLRLTLMRCELFANNLSGMDSNLLNGAFISQSLGKLINENWLRHPILTLPKVKNWSVSLINSGPSGTLKELPVKSKLVMFVSFKSSTGMFPRFEFTK